MNNSQKIIEILNKNKKKIRIMHICGTHERTISKYGIRSLLPESIEILSGPGCPVCVTPNEDIDSVIILSKKGYIILTYGDMLRVQGTHESLFNARSNGANVEMVYSIDDAIKISMENPRNKYIFFSIGFETTIPIIGNSIKKGLPSNLSIYLSMKLTIPAMEFLILDTNIDGFIAPGHVATIIGTKKFESSKLKNYPIVISGFEMDDILKSIFMLKIEIDKTKNNLETKVQNEYSRCVRDYGNEIASKVIDDIFDIVDSEWKGIGTIKKSGIKMKDKYKEYDAKEKYKNEYQNELMNIKNNSNKNKKCICSKILTGKALPSDCSLFINYCNPLNPIGACMVSDEGMCFNWYIYRNIRKITMGNK